MTGPLPFNLCSCTWPGDGKLLRACDAERHPWRAGQVALIQYVRLLSTADWPASFRRPSGPGEEGWDGPSMGDIDRVLGNPTFADIPEPTTVPGATPPDPSGPFARDPAEWASVVARTPAQRHREKMASGHLLDWKRYWHVPEADRPRIEQLVRDLGTRDVVRYASGIASLERHAADLRAELATLRERLGD